MTIKSQVATNIHPKMKNISFKISFSGARVGRITNDSNNIVDIVVNNYREIKQSVKLQLKNSIPGIEVKFGAKCEK